MIHNNWFAKGSPLGLEMEDAMAAKEVELPI